MIAGLSDLHRHLDGSLRPDTVADLARAIGVTVPKDLRFFPGMGLRAALSRFELTLSLLQELDAVRRVAAEMCEDAAADGVTTLEIRFAPQLHGHRVPQVVDAALEGIDGRAGLILCGLYGEPPAVLDELVTVGARRPGVVGIDLAGGPSTDHDWSLVDYAGPFRRAADHGLGRTVHAGEGRPCVEIRQAIEQLGAQRIGHGCSLLDDPAIVDLVLERGITIEACPSSNVHTGVYVAVANHPIARWLDRGIRVCVCTDNTLLSDVTATEEQRRVRDNVRGMDDARMALVNQHGHDAAFR